MSSPGGLQYSQSDFLARWMPSSSRAGVILNPSPVLAESLRHSVAWRSPPPRGPNDMMGPNDSFASDFAPLPVSPSSSCCESVDAVVPVAEQVAPAQSERTVFKSMHPMPPQHSFGEVLLANQSEELPLRMKLEQLRQWQQHMQEQLKAHQLEELLRLQEEQQRLLGINGSQRCGTDISELSGAEGEESTVQAGSPCGEALFSSTEEDQEQSFNASSHDEDYDSTLVSHNGMSMTEDHRRDQEKHSHDRPIKPGIGGQSQTFEELLEEQLRLEEQRQQQQSQNVAEAARFPPKRAFLRRGEGLSRFTKNNHKGSLPNNNREMMTEPNPQLRDRVITRRKSEPAMTQKATSTGSTNSGAQRFPVQRKTAVLNKENRPRGPCSPPQEVRTNSKPVAPRTTKVLGSHQRQNAVGTGHSALAPRKPGTQDRYPPNAVTKEVVGVAVTAGGSSKCQNGVGTREDTHGSRQRQTESEEVQGEDGGVPEYSFELALQEKLQRWDSARQMESMELGEFELLEEAAEELSFSSNSSFVMKVLQMDHKHRQLLAAKGLHQRRLSSTPIKSPRPSPPKALLRCNSLGSTGNSGGGGTSKSNTSDSQAVLAPKLRDLQKNKMDTDDGDEEDDGTDGKHGTGTDASFCNGSEFGDQEVAVQLAPPPTFPSNQICFQAPLANPPYDKRSYQDQDSSGRLAEFSDATEGEYGETDSIVSNPDDSTLIEDKDDQRDRLVFDDDDTWHDVEESVSSLSNDSRGPSPVSKPTANGTSPPERALKRKVAMNKEAGLDKGVVVSSDLQELDSVPPPTSQLMTRLFPSLKPKPQTAPPNPQPAAATEVGRAEDAPGKQVQSRLRERLVELELEIERFKKENAALTRLRQENEKQQENLRKEHAEFEQRKAEEMSKFEEYKKEESRRLQKERRVFERHATTVRAMPDKKEREEIQALKQQLSSVQDELRRQESRWSSTQSRLRQQIDSLSSENMALREEVSTLEKLRLSAWKKSQSDGERDKDKRESPRMFENSSVPAATKGVKFASPLDTRGRGPPQSSSTAATRGSLREPSLAATGMKSSLRKSSAPACLSSDLGRIMEERPASTTRTQDKTQSQEPINNTSPRRVCVQSEEQPTVSSEPESDQELITQKIETVLPCGGRLLVFTNGTRKEVSADGQTAKVTFFNGDTKQVMADQRVIYYFAEAQTTHTTYPDGMEILQFSNNQTEKHFPDGHKEITFPDHTVKTLYPDGRVESVLTDGTIIQVNPDGTKEIQFNTGETEVHTAQYKRRVYPDGTVKTVYTDGRQETRYPNRRVRIKDKDGNVVLDQIATDSDSQPF